MDDLALKSSRKGKTRGVHTNLKSSTPKPDQGERGGRGVLRVLWAASMVLLEAAHAAHKAGSSQSVVAREPCQKKKKEKYQGRGENNGGQGTRLAGTARRRTNVPAADRGQGRRAKIFI